MTKAGVSKRAVIFDMDGVLIDSEKYYNESDEHMLGSLGIEITEQIITRLTGSSFMTFPAFVREQNPKIALTDDELIKHYSESLFNASKKVTSLIDGVSEWIERFRGMGLKLALGSASQSMIVYDIINRFGLNMDAVVTSNDVSAGKPSPDIFLECAKRLDVAPADCVVIEDSENGVKAAINAKMTCVAFLGTQYHNFDLSPAHLKIMAYDEQNWTEFLKIL